MNKAERFKRKMRKYNKRVKLLKALNGDKELAGKLFSYRSHGAPCSCSLCKGKRYSRKIKHKNGEG